jgi:hypothetical protein
MASGGETGAKIGEHFGNMLEEEYNKYKHNIGLARGGMSHAMARGGMARGGVPSAGVGASVGESIERAIVNWWNSLGLARGGKPKKMPPAMMKDIKAMLKSKGIAQGAGVGASVGESIERAIVNWWNSLGLARGGMAGGPSVFR